MQIKRRFTALMSELIGYCKRHKDEIFTFAAFTVAIYRATQISSIVNYIAAFRSFTCAYFYIK